MDLATRRETFGQDDQSWLGSTHGTHDAARSITIAVSTFTEATHYPDGTLPSGTALALITGGANEGLYGLYDEEGANGLNVLAGFLLTAQRIRSGNVSGPLLEHGRVIVDRLPFPDDIGVQAQRDVNGRIVFADRDPLPGIDPADFAPAGG